ncbi:MAG: HEAT repeat domain-containing protein [Deltaproteobacteria bacterium]|nr:HEAT repeat domain-containing protein [Deltaproteobacteria bacterium]
MTDTLPKPLRAGGRALKRQVFDLLHTLEIDRAVEELYGFPPKRVINPLFSLLNHKDPDIRWAAVTASGAVVARLAELDIEGARIILRRIMWNLNDESGGIGWGLPEVMGEILARVDVLAEEFSPILLSYADEKGNYLEYDMLQRGLLWGIGRLAQVRPEHIQSLEPHLFRYFESPDAGVRGHAAWVAGMVPFPKVRSHLERLTGDDSEFQLYEGQRLQTRKVREVAAQALKGLEAV